MRELESVVLSVEELEAIRLVDWEGLYQEAAAERMEVSRQTFQRILREARRKVADALTNGKALGIEGGDYVLSGASRVFECISCGKRWEEPFGSGRRACDASCPDCGGGVTRVGTGAGGAGRGFGRRRGGGPGGAPGGGPGRRFGPPGGAGGSSTDSGGRVD